MIYWRHIERIAGRLYAAASRAGSAALAYVPAAAYVLYAGAATGAELPVVCGAPGDAGTAAGTALICGTEDGTEDVHAIEDADTLLLTVEELFRKGMQSSLVLQADTLNQMMAARSLESARMAQAPDVQVGLTGGYLGQPVVFLHGLSDATMPESPDWSQNYSIDVNQPVYQGGRIRRSICRSEIEGRIAGLQTSADASDIKLSLMEQYLDLFCLYKEYDVMKQNISESERRLQDIIRMKEEGLITNNDVLRSELQLSNDRISLQQTGNSIILASQRLDILLGLDEQLLIIPDTAALRPVMLAESYESCLMQACEADPYLKLSRERIALAENEVKIAMSDYLPTVSLYAGNTLARPVTRTMADMFSNSWSIGLSISYPISSLYRNRSEVSRRRHNVSLMANARDQAMQQVRMEVRDAWLRHEESLEQVKTLELSVLQAQENYRIMQNRYFEQLSILTDLLDANNVMLEAELQLTQARTRVIYNYYRLQRACGRL